MCLLMGRCCYQEHLEGLLVACPYRAWPPCAWCAAPLPQLRAECAYARENSLNISGVELSLEVLFQEERALSLLL